MAGESMGSIVMVSRGPRSCLFVLRECIWNAPSVSHFLSTLNDNGSLGFPLRRMVYPPSSTLDDCLPFSCGEYGGCDKSHHFLSFTFTSPCFTVLSLIQPPPP